MQAITETIDQWLQQMSSDWEAPLSLDEEGSCSIRSGNGYTLELFSVEATASCYFSIPLMDVPHEARESFYATILALNVHQQETCGGTLAVDPDRDGLLLCYSQPVATLTAELFANLIQNLIGTADTLVQKIREQTQQGTSASTTTSAAAEPAPVQNESTFQAPQQQYSHFMSLV